MNKLPEEVNIAERNWFMKIEELVSKLFVGEAPLLSRLENKKAVLRGWMAVIAVLVGVVYIVSDSIQHIDRNFPYYVIVIIFGFVTLWLNRRHRFLAASIVFLCVMSFIVYLFASSDIYRAGVYTFFLCISLSAFALFDFKQLRFSVFFSLLALVLFLVAYWAKYPLLPVVPLTEDFIRVFFTINFVVSFVTCFCIMYFLLRINFESERGLEATASDLQHVRERYQMVVEAVDAGIYEWRNNDSDIFVSATYKKLLGYAENELTNYSVAAYLNIIHPDDRERVASDMASHIYSRQPYSHPVRLRLKDGDFRWFQDSGNSKFDDKGNRILTVGSIMDIHEQKIAEEKILRQNAELAKANKELDRFAYSVSHDLRAPLSSILGLVNIYNLSTDTEERHAIVNLINNRAISLDSFIREILNYSRNARLEINPTKILLKPLIAEVLTTLEYMPGLRDIEFVFELDDHFEVHADRDRLKIVLSNLLSNGVKYRDIRKQSKIKISAKDSAGTWELYIEDNGMGILEEHQDKVFSMFYRAHETSQGSGLGLYIVKETITLMKGEISLISNYGEGTKFKLVFRK